MDAIVLGIYYRRPVPEDVDEAFLQQQEKALCSQDLVLMEDFKHPDICQKDGTAGHR